MKEVKNQMINAFKILFVKDKELSSQYYVKSLGFSDEGHGCFEREGVWIILHENKATDAIRPNHKVDDWSADIYVAVKGLEDYYEEFSSKNVEILKKPTIEMSGMNEFMIQDMDGY